MVGDLVKKQRYVEPEAVEDYHEPYETRPPCREAATHCAGTRYGGPMYRAPPKEADKPGVPKRPFPEEKPDIVRKVTDRYQKYAGLATDLENKVNQLIADYTKTIKEGKSAYVDLQRIGKSFEKWFLDIFRVNVSTTPKGGKPVKEKAKTFLWFALAAVSTRGGEGTDPQNWRGLQELRDRWAEFKPFVPDLVRMFSDEGKTSMVREIKGTYATYLNTRGLATKTFQNYVKALETLFGMVGGWRAKALGGNLTVSLAGPDAFRGTAAGKYVKATDTLLVRATPKIMQRTPGQYASPDYILLHELGHRYEEKFGTKGYDFQGHQWHTTRYSLTEGLSGASEGFAELFALGHFGIRKVEKEFGEIVDRFENLMSGKVHEEQRSSAQRIVARHQEIKSRRSATS